VRWAKDMILGEPLPLPSKLTEHVGDGPRGKLLDGVNFGGRSRTEHRSCLVVCLAVGTRLLGQRQ
jgi:hypothetical protein